MHDGAFLHWKKLVSGIFIAFRQKKDFIDTVFLCVYYIKPVLRKQYNWLEWIKTVAGSQHLQLGRGEKNQSQPWLGLKSSYEMQIVRDIKPELSSG